MSPHNTRSKGPVDDALTEEDKKPKPGTSTNDSDGSDTDDTVDVSDESVRPFTSQLKTVLKRTYNSIKKKNKANQPIDPTLKNLYLGLKLTAEVFHYQEKNATKSEKQAVWSARRDMMTFDKAHNKQPTKHVDSIQDDAAATTKPSAKRPPKQSKEATKQEKATKQDGNKGDKNGNKNKRSTSSKSKTTTLNSPAAKRQRLQHTATSPSRSPSDNPSKATEETKIDIIALKKKYPNIETRFHFHPDEVYETMKEKLPSFDQHELDYVCSKITHE